LGLRDQAATKEEGAMRKKRRRKIGKVVRKLLDT